MTEAAFFAIKNPAANQVSRESEFHGIKELFLCGNAFDVLALAFRGAAYITSRGTNDLGVSFTIRLPQIVTVSEVVI
ncbi:MAG: hypothetical protein KME26_26185 [Oscillatoria princeps RMCB-10]|nr:hypothetical protein [Oscillatoria princeps RMCB-10]